MFHWLQQFKPDLLSNTEFEGSTALPMIIAYIGIGIGLGFVTITGGQENVQQFATGEPMVLRTLEGHITASVGDWIVRGVAGEVYPVKPDIFLKTYEPAKLTT